MATRQVTLELTTEQEETIKALFGHYDWDYKEIQSNSVKERKRKRSCLQLVPQLHDQDDPGRVDDARGQQPEAADADFQDGECVYCFLAPCITLRNHAWIGPGQEACEYNSAIRREKYSKYWKTMACLGAWTDPRYLQVKQDRASGGEWAVSHRREVMPMCILQQLRTLYPNPKGKPYMDHKRE